MKIGKRSLTFDGVYIKETASVVGPDEGKCILKEYYDVILENDVIFAASYEKSETMLHTMSVQAVCRKANILPDEVDILLSGDLQNQICASTFMARKINTAFLGLYGACSTFGEALLVGGALLESGNAKNIICSTSSHFSTAERQYRMPLELGTQPTPTSQRTITGSGATLISSDKCGIARISGGTFGKVVDFGIKNAANMSAAMAPAAFDTFKQHLSDFSIDSDYYDFVLTGDLGKYGKQLFMDLCADGGIKLGAYNDGGAMIFGCDDKKMNGGSGAGCISAVFNSLIIKRLADKAIKRVLILPTGALLSKDTSLQNETIPSICYAVAVEGL